MITFGNTNLLIVTMIIIYYNLTKRYTITPNAEHSLTQNVKEALKLQKNNV